MILAIVFAHVYSVVQLMVLGSLARTVRMRTVFAAFAVGLYACAPLTALIQVGWTRPAAWLFGTSISSMVGVASYTLDPFMEEILKVVPVALLLTIPVIRRQWSMTDCVLVGAATGAGFGLAEQLFRFSDAAVGAQAVRDGWASIRNGGAVLWVPGYLTSLTSWLPDGISSLREGIRLSAHVAWSAAGGLAVGLFVLNRKREAWIAGVGLLLWVGLDHAANNAASIHTTSLSYLNFLESLRGLLPIAVLIAAWWLDRPRQRTTDPALLLAVERASGSPMRAMFQAAISRPPWSMLWIDRFARRRRACNTVRLVAPQESAELFAMVVKDRATVDRDLGQSGPLSWLPPDWTPNGLRESVSRPAVMVWLVLMAPSVLWFVVGGWPPTARIQAAMTGPITWKLVWLLTLGMQAWIVWSFIAGARAWPRTFRYPLGDDAAITGMRIACGIGSVALGGFALLRTLGGLSPRAGLLDGMHAAEAAASASPGDAAQVANSGGGWAAPPSGNSSDGSDSGSSAGSSAGDGAEGGSADGGAGGPGPGPIPPGEPTDLGELDDATDLGEIDEPTDLGELDEPTDLGEIDEPTDLGEIDEPTDLGEIDEPTDLGEIDEPTDLGELDDPADLGELDDPTDLGDLDDRPTTKTPAPQGPDEAALARARADKAADDALEAEADALQAKQNSQRADRAADAADIAKEMNPDSDPIVNDVRDLARQAHDKADKADIDSDGLKDPWNPDANKPLQDESKVADQDVQDAKQALADRKAAEASAANEAAKQAQADSSSAAAQAAAARENANAAEASAQAAENTAARNAARAADPKGAAANDAAADAAAAQKRADDVFMDQHATSETYRKAMDEAARARARADAAKAAADSSGSKPDKP